MPVLICLRKKLWTRTYSIRDQVPTCPVFTRAKIKPRSGIKVKFSHHNLHMKIKTKCTNWLTNIFRWVRLWGMQQKGSTLQVILKSEKNILKVTQIPLFKVSYISINTKQLDKHCIQCQVKNSDYLLWNIFMVFINPFMLPLAKLKPRRISKSSSTIFPSASLKYHKI